MAKTTFAVKYDDFRRRMEANTDQPMKPFKLTTAQIGTEEFEVYAELFISEDNTTIHQYVEDDKKTYTFFVLVPKTTLTTQPIEEPTNAR